jgi:hypothetical protein
MVPPVLADLVNLLSDLEQSLHVLGVDDPYRLDADLLQLVDVFQPKVRICVPFMTHRARSTRPMENSQAFNRPSRVEGQSTRRCVPSHLNFLSEKRRMRLAVLTVKFFALS